MTTTKFIDFLRRQVADEGERSPTRTYVSSNGTSTVASAELEKILFERLDEMTPSEHAHTEPGN
jgi:hypothetical protein